MIVTVVILILMVQLIQFIGDTLSKNLIKPNYNVSNLF